MRLKMVSLTRKPNGTYTARKGIPADVRDRYFALYGVKRERKFYASASTPLTEVKHRFAEWSAETDAQISAIRQVATGAGRSLTHREACALAGEWYAWFRSLHEDEPGGAAHWEELALHALLARVLPATPGDNGPLDRLKIASVDPKAARAFAQDHGLTGRFLLERGLVLTPEALDRFLDAVAPELEMIALRLRRHAEGDYTPDDREARFPKARGAKLAGWDCWQLFEAWVNERKPKPSTVDRRRGVFLHLQAHFGSHDIAAITEQDAVAWKDTLLTPDRSGRTINDVWLVTAKGVFKWAVINKRIERNPFEGLRVVYASAARNRDDKAFTPDEARMILRASLKEQPKRLSAHYKAARRWVPWLCAYSGMRAQEATQLRGEDIVEQDGIWAIRIKPDAGTQKTNQARTIPVHEHLIDLGFLDFVKGAGRGPLFYDAAAQAAQRTSDLTNPQKALAVKTREHLAKWVRDIGVDDPELAPNHAWRDLFKAICDNSGIPEKISDAITGHAPANVARTYGKPGLAVMAKELRKFPRFSCD
jgi:integrase